MGEPRGGYPNGEGPLEWTFDLVLDEEAKKKLNSLKVSKDYIKSTDDGQDYIRFTRKAVKKDGTPGAPIRIVDHKNNPWGNELIGNGSTLNVSFTINEVNSGKAKKLKPSVLAVQVWDLQKYSPKSSFQTRDDTGPVGDQQSWTEE